MNLFKYHSFLLVLLLFVNSRTFSQSEVLYSGEELYYEVNYSFINIGWAKFNTSAIAGKPGFFTTTAKLKSNNSLPFINVDYDFTSIIELKGGMLRPHKFTAYEYKDDKRSELVCDFNYDSNFITIKKSGFDKNIEMDKKILTSTVFQDGLSIFYYARLNARKDKTEYVPVLMHTDTALMKINYSSKNTEIEISDIEYDISSVFLDGFLYFKAVFGLTGNFSGWFSNDAAAVPLKAKLEVEIGNITLELKSWKRSGWTPPKY